MRIIDLVSTDESAIQQVAALLVEGFAENGPFVVRVSQRGKGIGRTLVADLEERVRERGGLTVTLGTDDVNGQTSLSGMNLYPNVWEHLARIRNLKRHPYEFYQKQGFVMIGVVPDANGLGKPDILMAKSVIR